jgi:aspartate kinase
LRLIHKFGGTALATGARIRQAAQLVRHHRASTMAVVVSAGGQTTDQLLEACERAGAGDVAHIQQFVASLGAQHRAAAQVAVRREALRRDVLQALADKVDQLSRALTGMAYLGEVTPKSRDFVASFGERFTADFLWGALTDAKVAAQRFAGGEVGIVTDSNYGEAHPLLEATYHQVQQNLAPLVAKHRIPVVTGFIAVDQHGNVTTLGRGGSDYTASILGAALRVDEIWLWTDVDGVLSTDPRIVPNAQLIPTVSFPEALELSVLGVKALHPRAFEPAMAAGIPVRIRNCFNPQHPGTRIIRDQRVERGRIVKVVMPVWNVALVTVSGASMVGAPGTAASVFRILGEQRINIMMISQSVSEANISVIVARAARPRAVNALELALVGRGIVSEVAYEDDVCVVAAIGAGMKGTPGVAARLFGALARRGINVRMVAQGSSELNMSLVVREADGKAAVRAIHEEFALAQRYQRDSLHPGS